MNAQTILITGASTGIGKATAQILMKENHHLFLVSRRPEVIHAWIDTMDTARIKATFEVPALDVSDPQAVDDFFDKRRQEHTTLHTLINNAGFAKGIDHVKNASWQDWDAMMKTNFLGAMKVAQGALDLMPKHAGSRIINVGSIAGLQGYPGGGGYCGSKFALKALSQTLRLELLEHGIGVTSIEPGLVETQFSNVRLQDEQKAKDVYKGMTPLTATDVAKMIVFVMAQPPHVNIDTLVTMPTAQASAFHVHRDS